MPRYWPGDLYDEAEGSAFKSSTVGLLDSLKSTVNDIGTSIKDTASLGMQAATSAAPPLPSLNLPPLDAFTKAWSEPTSSPASSSTSSSLAPTAPAPEAPEQSSSPVDRLLSSFPTLPPVERFTQAWQEPEQPKPAETPNETWTAGSGTAVPETTTTALRQAPANGQAATTPSTRQDEPLGEVDNSTRQSFIRTAYPHMLQAAGGDKNLAELMLAKAISENGSIGTGKPFFANNFSGIKGEGTAGSVEADTWEEVNGQRVNIRDRFAAYNTPQEGMAAFMQFLRDNKRYAPALARYQQSGDASQLFRDIREAGYATDSVWADKVEAIRRDQVAPITQGLAAEQPAPASSPVAAKAEAQAGSAYAPGSYTPNQINAATSEGLDYETALAVCGPAAAIAFARKNGRNPSMSEALDLAKKAGWTSAQGMAGPRSQQVLLDSMGVASRLIDGAPDWQSVAADVQRGNPVIISTPGHYFVAERFNPEDGTYDFGESAAVLKASGGRRWFKPEELASLGMGAPRASLFMDSPQSPAPSVVAGRASAEQSPDMLRQPLSQQPADVPDLNSPVASPAPLSSQDDAAGPPLLGPGDGAYAPEVPGSALVKYPEVPGISPEAPGEVPGSAPNPLAVTTGVEVGRGAGEDAYGPQQPAPTPSSVWESGTGNATSLPRTGANTAWESGTGMVPDEMKPGGLPAAIGSTVTGLPRNLASVPATHRAAVDEAARDIIESARATGKAYDEGRVLDAIGNGLLTGLNTIGAPFTVAGKDIDALFPEFTAQTELGQFGPGEIITNADALYDVGRLVAAGIKITPRVARALASGQTYEQILVRAARGIDNVAEHLAENRGRVAALDAERAGQGAAPAYGTLGLSPAENEMRGLTRPQVRPDAADIEARAVQEFGTTESPRETGYVLRDGSGLDFSGRRYGASGYTREMDHREIGRATGQGGTEGMHQFMSDTGAVRFSNYGQDISVDIPGGLSAAQKQRLLEEGKYAEFAAVDITNPKTGETVASHEFDFPRDRGKFNQLIRSLPDHVVDEATAAQAEAIAKRESVDVLRGRIAFAEDVLNGKHGPADGQARSYYAQSMQRDRAALETLENASDTAYGALGPAPAPGTTGGTGRLGAFNRGAGQAISSAVSGGITGEAAAQADPDDPYARQKGFVAGALAPPLAARGIRSVVGRRGAEGALGVFGMGGGRPASEAAAAAPDPIMRRMAGMMAGNTPPPTTNRRGLAERWAQAWTDDRAGLRAFQETVASRIGRPLTATETVAELTRVNPASVASQRLDDALGPVLQRVGDDDDYLAQYLTHSHNVDVAREMGQRAYDAAIAASRPPVEASRRAMLAANTRAFSGDLTLVETTDQLAKLEQRVRGLPDGDTRWQAVRDAAQGVWDFNRETLERKRDAGIISDDLFNELTSRYPRYVRTDIADYFDKGASGPAPAGRRLGVSDIGIQKLSAEGTSKERVNPLLSTIDQTYSAESAIVRNEAGKAFEELVRLDPTWASTFKEVVPAQGVNRGNPATTVPSSYTLRNGEQFLKVWQNGEARTYVIPPEYAALVAPQAGRIFGDSGAANAWRWMMNTYKSLITSKNPAFSMIVSPLRDAGDYAIREATLSAKDQGLRGAIQAAGALPGVMAEYVRAIPDAFAGILEGTYKGDLARMMREGAGQGSRPGHDLRELRQAYDDLRRTNGFEVKSAKDLVRIAGNVLTLGAEPIGGRLEQIPRLAASRRAAARGAEPLGQAMAFRDATVDFQRAGEWSRAINGVVPFFNVAVQGGAQTVRTARANPAAFMSAVAATLGTATVAAEAWNNADEQRAADYADVPDYLKRTGIVIMLPGVEGRSQRGDRLPNYVWVPVGQYGSLVSAAREAIQKTAKGEGGPDLSTPSGWAELGAEVAGIFSPLRGESAGAVLSAVTPPGLSTGLELAANKDLFRGSTIATDRRDEDASALAQGSAGAFNAATGQETRPSQWEYLYRDLGGYGATLATAGSNLLAEGLGLRRPKDEDRPIQNAPVVGGLVNRVVRDTGGQGMETATEDRNRVPESIRPILQEAGLRREEVTPVSSTYRGAPLTRAEQERWQRATDALIVEYVNESRDSAGWDDPAKRQDTVRRAISRAKEIAARDALADLDKGTIQDRIERQQQRKAS